MTNQTLDFEQQKAQLERVWQIGEKNGFPTPEYLKVYEMVLLELKQVIWPDLTVYGIANALADWIKTKNQTYLDLAISACDEVGISPTTTIQKQSAIAAKRRLAGEVIGSSKSVLNAKRKSSCYVLMIRLIYVGATTREAARKAQLWAKQRWPNERPPKASTLEKGYEVDIKKDGVDIGFYKSWDNSLSQENKASLKRERELLQEIDEGEAGERR